jgi:SAM-dependent methyltransferase
LSHADPESGNVATETLDQGERPLWKRFGAWLFDRAMDKNLAEIQHAILRSCANPSCDRLLDLGCGDAKTTLRYVPAGVALFGAELSFAAAQRARSAGIQVVRSDLNRSFPWANGSFDIVSSNQVFEHLYNTDIFLSESYRLLRPGGHLVLSTENLASWHNIFALLMGWQAFSLTHVSQRASGIGNPLANLRGSDPREPGWEHMRIFSYRGLVEVVAAHGFTGVKAVGAGYYPLPSMMAHLDPRHAAFITVIAERP